MTEQEQNLIEDTRLRRDPRDEAWENWQGAVLLKNEIKYYSSLDPPLIKPLDKKSLKPASYLLHLGKECQIGDEDLILSEKNPKLIIPPHGLAFVSTLEEINIPGFLIGRWNLRVTEVYEGLLWVGGAQVDPGYNGRLYCPLYNLSTKPAELRYKDALFAIDFVRTTRFVEGESGLWERKREDVLGAHNIHRLQSATSEDLKKVDEIADKVDEIAARTETAQRTVLGVLAIVVTAVTVIAMVGALGRFEDVNNVAWAAIGISGAAVVMAFFALFKIKSHIKRKKK